MCIVQFQQTLMTCLLFHSLVSRRWVVTVSLGWLAVFNPLRTVSYTMLLLQAEITPHAVFFFFGLCARISGEDVFFGYVFIRQGCLESTEIARKTFYPSLGL